MRYPVIDLIQTGRNLKRLCQARALSARDIQRYLGLASVQSVYDWFHSRNLPTIDNLLALSHLLNVSMEELLILQSTSHALDPMTTRRLLSYYYCLLPRSA